MLARAQRQRTAYATFACNAFNIRTHAPDHPVQLTVAFEEIVVVIDLIDAVRQKVVHIGQELHAFSKVDRCRGRALCLFVQRDGPPTHSDEGKFLGVEDRIA